MRPQVEADAAGVTMGGVRSHALANHMGLLCHGFIKKIIYINKILLKTRLQFFLLRVTM